MSIASYGVEDPEFAITQLAQTTMRSELGKMTLDKVFRERVSLNVSIVESINKASEAWGNFQLFIYLLLRIYIYYLIKFQV